MVKAIVTRNRYQTELDHCEQARHNVTVMQQGVFCYREGQLCAGEVPLRDIANQTVTPFYVYSVDAVINRFQELEGELASTRHLTCVALKANYQPALIRPLKEMGAGVEVVSGGELSLALALGFAPEHIVFSGVGKSRWELEAGLAAKVRLFLVESAGELRLLESLCGRMSRRARVALRINPDIDPKTHRHMATGISTAKFGLDLDTAKRLYRCHRDFSHLDFVGIHSHIGSQITDIAPVMENATFLRELVVALSTEGVPILDIDVGGGLGIQYDKEETPSFKEYVKAIRVAISRENETLILEPGRALLGPVGALVVQVLYVKVLHGRLFAVVDAGMNDLLRPALYGAYHRIMPLADNDRPTVMLDVAGAACESSDIFARDRKLPHPKEGEFLAILDAGAYGYSMSSNYNLRPRPAEVTVQGRKYQLVRPAESPDGLVRRELLP